jgi:transcriptional regulator GlxA family with amidase domain
MDSAHRVVMLIYPDAQMLDITGPLEVFARTSRWLCENDYCASPPYSLQLVAEDLAPVRCSSGIEIVATARLDHTREADTLLVSGGIGYARAADNPAVIGWLSGIAAATPRVASICTGALLLARAGLLDNRRATTHWAYCDELEKAGRNISVDPDAIYVRDGNIMTSAGVTSGIDMALAMVEADWGQPVAVAIARQLVMYLKRPGGQSQFSEHLRAQTIESDRLQQLQLWLLDHLDDDLSVPSLARRVSMSERSFSRRFHAAIGTSPAKYVERCRVSAARNKLEQTNQTHERIATACGFRSGEILRRAFIRELGVSPTAYRERFRSSH